MKCRKCKEYFDAGDNYATKATRHNYHWSCLFEGKQEWEIRTILLNLPKSQLQRIPWKVHADLEARMGLPGYITQLISGPTKAGAQ